MSAEPAAPVVDDATLARAVTRDALELAALQRSPRLAASVHRVRALAHRARQGGSLPAPELMTQLWQVPIARPYRVDQAGMMMLSLRQEIPAPGSLEAAAASSAREAEAEAANAEVDARALVREVDLAFADYVEATTRHEAHVGHRRLLEELSALAKARYAAGGALTDLTKAELERAQLEAHIAHEHGGVDEARARLNALLVRPGDASLGLPDAGEPRAVHASATALTDAVLEKHPLVVAAHRMSQAAESATDAASIEAKVPKLGVAADLFLPNETMPWGWGAELSMSLPWLSGAGRRAVASASEHAAERRALEDVAKAELRGELGAALARARAAERRLVLTRDGAKVAASRALDAARTGYATGGADILAWIDAARMVLDVEVELSESRGALDRALADLDFAAGERLPRAPLDTSLENDHER